MSSEPEISPVPRDFGWRWLAWLAWTNKLSILFVLQGTVLELTVDSDIPKSWVHHLLALYNMIGLVLAQVSRKQGTIAPPTKEPKP